MSLNARQLFRLGCLLLGLVLVLLVVPFFGMETLSPRAVFGFGNSEAATLFWQLRLPRVLGGMLVGAVLAGCGLVFQAVFRNALATPFTLGTASGASLGASLALAFGIGGVWAGVNAIAWFAFLGAILALALIYWVGRLRLGMSTDTMLLAGVAESFIFSSLIVLIQYLSNQANSLRVMRWLMGGLDLVGYGTLFQMLPICLAGFLVLGFFCWDLNLLAVGEDLAASRGMNVGRTRWFLLLLCGLMVGVVVAASGPIGFVGLMVPHLCRQWLGSDHRVLLPASLLLGAGFLPVCDTAARMLVAPAELPVGIITALLGGPFFIWLLVKHREQL